MDKIGENIGLTWTTVGKRQEAVHLSKTVVEKKLAACAQIDEVFSIYTWEDEIQEDIEYRILFKHTILVTEKLQKYLEEYHPYDVPEIISWDGHANESYSKWCRENCNQKTKDE